MLSRSRLLIARTQSVCFSRWQFDYTFNLDALYLTVYLPVVSSRNNISIIHAVSLPNAMLILYVVFTSKLPQMLKC